MDFHEREKPLISFNTPLTNVTGPQFGSDVMVSLMQELKLPVILDFAGVESLGSSFGDEIAPVIAEKQGNTVKILNANSEVKATLKDIDFNSKINLEID